MILSLVSKLVIVPVNRPWGNCFVIVRPTSICCGEWTNADSAYSTAGSCTLKRKLIFVVNLCVLKFMTLYPLMMVPSGVRPSPAKMPQDEAGFSLPFLSATLTSSLNVRQSNGRNLWSWEGLLGLTIWYGEVLLGLAVLGWLFDVGVGRVFSNTLSPKR